MLNVNYDRDLFYKSNWTDIRVNLLVLYLALSWY